MNQVKICGKLGLVTFCPSCKDWRPFDSSRVFMVASGQGLVPSPPVRGGWCIECNQRLPEVTRYTVEEPLEHGP